MDEYRKDEFEDEELNQDEREWDDEPEEQPESEPPRYTEQEMQAYILARIKAGDDKAAIAKRLTEQGLRSAEASHLVETHYAQIVAMISRQQYRSEALLPAVAGGVLAALAGGIVWGVISLVTEREIGIIAWAIGWLTGYAVVLFAGKRKGLPLQLVAVITAILGIAVGKYVTFIYQLKDAIAESYGAEIAAELSPFSEEAVRQFFENIQQVVGGYDILWVVLAVATAWGIPKGLGIKLPESGYYPFTG